LTNQAFNQCLRNKKIFLYPKAKGLVQKELRIAQDDLAEAKNRFQNAKYKYAIINAYYAVFHASRALLYSKGYRERSHSCLVAALDALFVESGELNSHFVQILRNAMILREDADYAGTFSKEGASLNISNAEEFINKSMELLKVYACE